MAKKKESKDIIKFEGEVYKKEAFLIEEEHPAIGRMLIVGGKKFRILDDNEFGGHGRTGTFIRELRQEDIDCMEEYDADVEALSKKLVGKVDVERLIKEHVKKKPHQEIKTGLYILKAEESGEKIEEEHVKRCYNYNMFYKNQGFSFFSGPDVEMGR